MYIQVRVYIQVLPVRCTLIDFLSGQRESVVCLRHFKCVHVLLVLVISGFS